MFGKSGARRIVPGQYLATNPKGRAVMIAAMEKSKLVNPSIVHHIVGIYVGFENPMFAALEVDYVEADQDPTGEAAANAGKLLTYYELDLGLNHVVRKWSEPTDPKANLLNADAPQHRSPTPRREHPPGDSGWGIIITAVVMHKWRGPRPLRFLSSTPTLPVQQIGDDALLQVHPQGIRQVLADRRVNEWRVPSGKSIVATMTNVRQVVVALSSAELMYFELDLDWRLNEYQDQKAMEAWCLH
ncbi:hypothetical protein BJV78DRAFT_1284773 [Lactifluus subvellereus]|nr:hypothetical protein BJV78DRAFT_1284773 [Lactifluus subvellereus]